MIDRILNSRVTTILFALSAMSFVVLEATVGDEKFVFLNYIISFLIAFWIEHRYHVLSKIFSVRKTKYYIISFIISVFTTFNIAFDFNKIYSAPFLDIKFVTIVGITALFTVFCLTYFIVSRIKNIVLLSVRSSDKLERLYFFISFAVFSVLVVLAYNITDVAYTERGGCDIIFTTDSSSYVNQDVFFRLYSSENDVRQPLFALAALPLAVIAKALSYPFFFLPSAYILILQLLQIAVLLITVTILGRMVMPENAVSRLAFLVLYTTTFPIFLFSFVVEQYIISTFMLIFSIYVCMTFKNKSPLLLAVSSGTLLTNAVVVPFASYGKKNSDRFRDLVKTVIIFITCCILCGKLTIVADSFESIKKLMRFANTGGDNNTLGLKMRQFTHFITNCFIAPDTIMTHNKAGMPSLQLAIPSEVSIMGIVLAIIIIISILSNAKKAIAKACGLWAFFGTLILLVIGWGSPENGMILYSLYFGWALFVLVFMLAEKVLNRFKVAKNIAYFGCLITLTAVNFSGIINLVRFGIKYYPAWI